MLKLICKKIQIQALETGHSIMSPLELRDFIDFDVKRVYFMSKVTAPTSSHAHFTEKELFIMVAGTCVAEIDRGNGLEDIPLASPTDALYIGNWVWHHFKDFSPNAVLLALSSTNYGPDRTDYIENYEEYRHKVSSA